MTLQPVEHAAGPWTPPDPARLLTGQETAKAVGLSWERFRKVRLDWTRDRDFPAELNEPGEHVTYSAGAVARWVERRSRRVHAPPLEPPPPEPRAGDQRAAASGRAQLRRLKGTV